MVIPNIMHNISLVTILIKDLFHKIGVNYGAEGSEKILTKIWTSNQLDIKGLHRSQPPAKETIDEWGLAKASWHVRYLLFGFAVYDTQINQTGIN